MTPLRKNHILVYGSCLLALLLIAGVWAFRDKSPTAAVASVQGQESNATARTPLSPKRQGATSLAEPSDYDLLQDITKRLEALKGQNDSDYRANFEKLVEAIAKADVPRVLEHYWKDPTQVARDLRERLLRRWAEESPAAAGQWLKAQAAGASREEGVSAIATVWAGRSMEEASRWVRDLPEGERATGILAVAYEAAGSNPLEAMELSLELPADKRRDDLVSHIASQWAAVDPQGAVDWALQIEAGSLRDEVIANMATTWSETDPVAAANLALESIPPGKIQEDAVVGVVQRWVQQDAEAAAQWVLDFPDGNLREAAIENLVQLWADQDLQNATDWLNGLSAGPLRDSAAAALASFLSPSDPRKAAEWAEGIQNPVIRQQELERLGSLWLANDSEAARAWLQTTSLSPEIKARILESAPGAKPLPETP